MPQPWAPGDKWSEQPCPWPGHFWHPERAGCRAKVLADLAPGEEGEAPPEEVKTVLARGHKASPSPSYGLRGQAWGLRTSTSELYCFPRPSLASEKSSPKRSPRRMQLLPAKCLSLRGHPGCRVGKGASTQRLLISSPLPLIPNSTVPATPAENPQHSSSPLCSEKDSSRPCQCALGVGLLLTIDPDPKCDLTSRAISTLCPRHPRPTTGGLCTESWLLPSGAYRLKEFPSATLPVVRGLLCQHFPPPL